MSQTVTMEVASHREDGTISCEDNSNNNNDNNPCRRFQMIYLWFFDAENHKIDWTGATEAQSTQGLINVDTKQSNDPKVLSDRCGPRMPPHDAVR